MHRSPGCVLRSLTDPHLDGAVPGLTITQHEMRMSPTNFQCCEGTGVQLGADGRDSHRCDLRSRTARVAALVRQFRETWGTEAPLPLKLPATDVADLASRMHDGAKGRSLARKAPMQGPSPIWAIALAAAWRFGWHVHVATLGRTPWEKLTFKNAGHPLLVVVEGIDSLWDVRRADELEFVVGWAYHARAQLWCDWLLHLPPESTGRRRLVSHRIAEQRSRSPLTWLNADMHSKLSFLTDGLDPIIRWPTSRAPGKPAPSVDHRPKNL